MLGRLQGVEHLLGAADDEHRPRAPNATICWPGWIWPRSMSTGPAAASVAASGFIWSISGHSVAAAPTPPSGGGEIEEIATRRRGRGGGRRMGRSHAHAAPPSGGPRAAGRRMAKTAMRGNSGGSRPASADNAENNKPDRNAAPLTVDRRQASL